MGFRSDAGEMKSPSPSPVPSPLSARGFLTKPAQAFPLVSEALLEMCDLLPEDKLCCRCDMHHLDERDLLFVPLQKFGVGMHRLLASRLLPAASPTPP